MTEYVEVVDGGAWEAAMPLAFMVIPSATFLWLLLWQLTEAYRVV